MNSHEKHNIVLYSPHVVSETFGLHGVTQNNVLYSMCMTIVNKYGALHANVVLFDYSEVAEWKTPVRRVSLLMCGEYN